MNHARTIWRRATLTGALVLIVLLACATWVRLSEPRYQGKQVSFWFEKFSNLRLTSGGYHIDKRGRRIVVNGKEVADPSLEALVAMGEPAAAYLGKRVAARNILNVPLYCRVFTNVPASFRSVLPNPYAIEARRIDAATALISFGSKAQKEVPAIIDAILRQPGYITAMLLSMLSYFEVPRSESERLITSLTAQARYADTRKAIDQLRLRSRVVPQVIAELLAKTGSTDIWHFENLREYGAEAAPCLPTLLQTLKSTDSEVRYQTVRTLETIGPAAAKAIPDLEKCLADESSMVRSAAKRAIRAITAITPPATRGGTE